MKTIRFARDFDYMPTPKFLIAYKGGTVVERVPEAAVRKILEAGAGEIVEAEKPAAEKPAPKPAKAKRK